MSRLKISYHHLSSAIFGISNTSSMRRLSAIKTASSWTLLESNWHLMLGTIQEENRSQNMFHFSVSFYQENAKWLNINVFCDITSENV
jgi:hypothetical protein